MVEIKGNLFDSILLNKPNVMIAHCVSADYALGAGFALEVENRFHIRDTLKQIGTYNYPDCIAVGNILNLVTKGAYWTKPTYETFRCTLELARKHCLHSNIEVLLMPRIGCGLDRLDWKMCKRYIEEVLEWSGIQCSVYRLK